MLRKQGHCTLDNERNHNAFNWNHVLQEKYDIKIQHVITLKEFVCKLQRDEFS